MNQEIIHIQQLREPFPFEQVTAHIQTINGDKTKGLAVFRLTAHAIQDRLDLFGPFCWRNEYVAQQNNSQICGLSLYNSERGEWVTKYGGNEDSGANGCLADSFVHSAELWGVGRYLRRMDGVWVDVEKRDNGYCVKDGQQGVLKSAYDKAVAEIFGTAAAQNTPADMTGKKEQQNMESPQQPSAPVEPEYDYKVRSVKQSGKNSQLLELVNKNGDVTAAYIKANGQGIKTGASLNQVVLEKKNGAYGAYNLISGYQIAA